MENGRWKVNKKVFGVFVFLLTAYCFPLFAQAQTDAPPKDAAPPPMKMIPKDERNRLEAEKDLKKRTRLSLNLLETHLKKAEQLTEQDDYQNALGELGNFQAILENILNFLNAHDNGGGKVRNNFKRLEIGIRPTLPRLEIVRRGMPFSYGYYVQSIQKFVRDARSKALDPLFDDSVVKQ